MKISNSVVVLLCVILPLTAVADDAEVAQAADDHELGRVFMSSAERQKLDRLRKLSPSAEQPGAPEAATPAADQVRRKRPPGAGYIESSHGVSQQWINGDFRPVSRGQINAVGDSASITIIRHRKDSGADGSAGPAAAATPDPAATAETVSEAPSR